MSERHDLVRAVTERLEDNNVAATFSESEDRCWWDRQVGHVRRHIRVVPIMEDHDETKFTGRYSVLFGQNTGSGRTDRDNFDARRWGELDEVLDYVRTWLVVWAGPEQMKTPRPL